MAYEIKANGNVLKYARPGSYVVIHGSIVSTHVDADSDGRKIIPAGTLVFAGSESLRKFAVAQKMNDYDGASTEAILCNDVDVTSGIANATFLIVGEIDADYLGELPYGAGAALKANGLSINGDYTEASYNPNLAFSCTPSTTEAGKMKIAAVTPVIGSAHTYMYGVQVNRPAVGDDLSDDNDWAAYTLGTEITVAESITFVLAEVDDDGLVVKCGAAASAPAATPELLTFVCTDHDTAASTQIASVDPVLTEGNSYKVVVNEDTIPPVGTDATAIGAAYTLEAAIAAVNAQPILLLEVDGGSLVVGAGVADAVVA